MAMPGTAGSGLGLVGEAAAGRRLKLQFPARSAGLDDAARWWTDGTPRG